MSEYIPRQLTYVDEQGNVVNVSEEVLLAGEEPKVVLGEPGMGKTELMLRLGDEPGFRYITARGLVRQHPDKLSILSDQILVIDALDEVAAGREEDPVHQVLTKLSELKNPKFIISCRAADWRGALARHDIQTDYGLAPREFHLTPLSRAEAEDFLAKILGQSKAARTVEGLVRRSLHSLFGNPLTLRLIAKFVGEKELPENRGELFQQACELLWQEHNERKAGTALANLSQQAALDAAGAACAALLLTASEAISREAPGAMDEGDLHIAALGELPNGLEIPTVLSSGLFRRVDLRDRFAPLHRSVAEYLAARWLAAKASNQSRRRLLALMRYSGGVPASLRGVHAWLAHFSADLAPDVISADPYGVLRYGDSSRLRVSEAKLLLHELSELSKKNPRFRSGDSSQFTAWALTQPALLSDLKSILSDQDAEFELRLFVLESLEGAPVVPSLERELCEIAFSEGKKARPYAERRAAADALLSSPAISIDWSGKLASLCRQRNESPRRLAVELIAQAGPNGFSSRTIVDAVLGYLGLLADGDGSAGVELGGPLYFLARKLPPERTGEILDLLATVPVPEKMSWRLRHDLNDFVGTLILNQLQLSSVAPLRLLSWLRAAAFNEGGGREESGAISEFLRNKLATRREIQRHVLLHEESADGPWMQAWKLQEIGVDLYPTPDDVVELLGTPELRPLDDPARRTKWKEVLQIVRRQDGLPEPVLSVARHMARGDAELSDYVEQLANPSVPDWKKRQEQRQAEENRAREARWEKHRENFRSHLDKIRRGELGPILPLAKAYFHHFADIDGDTPHERLRRWVGEDLLAVSLKGFEAVLHRPDLPTAESVAKSYAASSRWNFMLPILAGLCERVTTGRGFDDLDEEVLISGRLGVLYELFDEESGGRALERHLDSHLRLRPALFERYVRLAIEPQLAKADTKHVTGLYQLVRAMDAQELLTRLCGEWLKAYPSMSAVTELELIGRLIHSHEWELLRNIAAERLSDQTLEKERRLSWSAIQFLTAFDAERAHLDAVAAAHSEFLWHIRNLTNADGYERSVPLEIPPKQLAWLVSTFRRAHPYTRSPRGVTAGDTNAWDATSFLVTTIYRIASDTSDVAINALRCLRDDEKDAYTPIIRQALAQQQDARREADFAPTTLDELIAVLQAHAPRSTLDLQAIALDELDKLQRVIRGDDVGTVNLFYDSNAPLKENQCRDRLIVLLRQRLPYGIEVIPERQMPAGRRADLVLQYQNLQLPIEAKGQWNKKLWTAANDQLDAFYAVEWRASGAGIYLIFWFGDRVPNHRKLKQPVNQRKPPTPEELQEALTNLIPEQRRSDLAVFVLDVSR